MPSPHYVRPSPGLRPPSPTSWEKADWPKLVEKRQVAQRAKSHNAPSRASQPTLANRPSPTKWERVAEGRVRAERSEGR